MNHIERLGSTLCTSLFSDDFCKQVPAREASMIGVVAAGTFGVLFAGYKIFKCLNSTRVTHPQPVKSPLYQFIDTSASKDIFNMKFNGMNVVLKALLDKDTDSIIRLYLKDAELPKKIEGLKNDYLSCKKTEFELRKSAFQGSDEEFDRIIDAYKELLNPSKEFRKFLVFFQAFELSKQWDIAKATAILAVQ